MTTSTDTVLEAKGLSKAFGAVRAISGVDVAIRRGEVLALIGDNGAGKSTLVRLLSGALQPDEGEILLNGKATVLDSPHDARANGIETVYQDLALAPGLDVAANLYLGREPTRRFLPHLISVIDRRSMERGAAEHLARLGLQIPVTPGRPVVKLSGGQRQAVSVARAVKWVTDVLFLDEPTAALGVKQTVATFELARRVARDGLAVVLITHSLPHVMEFADRIVVLRRGTKVADLATVEATPERLVSLIVGFETESPVTEDGVG